SGRALRGEAAGLRLAAPLSACGRGRNDAPHALPPQADAATRGLEVRTVAGLPPLKIFTRLCRLVSGIKPSREARAPAVSDGPHPEARGARARLPAATDDLSAFLSDESKPDA